MGPECNFEHTSTSRQAGCWLRFAECQLTALQHSGNVCLVWTHSVFLPSQQHDKRNSMQHMVQLHKPKIAEAFLCGAGGLRLYNTTGAQTTPNEPADSFATAASAKVYIKRNSAHQDTTDTHGWGYLTTGAVRCMCLLCYAHCQHPPVPHCRQRLHEGRDTTAQRVLMQSGF